MTKNKRIRKLYEKVCPIKFEELLIREINNDYEEFLKTNPTKEEIFEEKNDRDYNTICAYHDIEIYYSNKIIRIAKRYGVPLPSAEPKFDAEVPSDSEWSQSIYGFYYLNDKGRYELKKKIDEEKKIKREIFTQILSIIIGFMGLFVAIISLLKY